MPPGVLTALSHAQTAVAYFAPLADWLRLRQEHGDNHVPPIFPCATSIAVNNSHLNIGLVSILAALLTACAPLHPYSTMTVSQMASPNFDERRPNLVIIHHSSDNTPYAFRA